LEEIAEMTTWLREAIQTHQHQLASDVPIDTDLLNLSIPPSFTASASKKITAYGNDFQIEDGSTNMLVAYASGVASGFQQSEGSEDVLGVIQYVGIFKQILKLDYGPMSSPIVLFHCSWVKNGTDSRGNPTFNRDNASFLLANFRHLLHELHQPFVLPSQIHQVFFWNDPKTPFWKVLLHREPRSRRVLVNTFEHNEIHAVLF